MLTDLVSPTHKTPYTMDCILRKGFERAGLAGMVRIERKYTCEFESSDYYVHAKGIRCTSSMWTDSVNFSIDGIIPIHANSYEKLSYGFGCGYSSEENDDPEWKNYDQIVLGKITCWIGSDEENKITYSLSDIPSGDPAQEVILRIVETLLARECFRREISDF